MQTKFKSFGNKVNYGIQIAFAGIVTGLFVGVAVTLFQAAFELCEEFAAGYYGFFRTHPAFIPLLFAALFLGAIVMGGLMKAFPMIRGGGFPQVEGATQGLLRFRWYQVLTGMFAAGLFAVFMGLSGGSEGPALMIGGACGDGFSTVFRRNAIVRRYQITSGACAGLAIALNAPLTGMIFAYEEAHKRFTPEVFICSFSAVALAIIVRNLLRPALGLEVGPFLENFVFDVDPGLRFSLFAFLAAIVVALAGVAFYYLLFFIRKYVKKFRLWKGYGNVLLPFLLAGVVGLISVGVTGSGLELIDTLGSASEDTMSVFGASLFLSLLIILLLKFAVTALNTASDLPCCCSVPMMAMGAVIGKLMSLLFVKMGMSAADADVLIVICMVTFFTTVVKAPMTGIIMSVELTWSFTFLLPAVLSVAVGYLIGSIFRMEPLYERLLEEILEERDAHTTQLTVTVRVTRAAGAEVREILWPFSAHVLEVRRGDETILPNGSTELREDDLLTVIGRPEDVDEYLSALALLGEVGEPVIPPEDPPETSSENPPTVPPVIPPETK